MRSGRPSKGAARVALRTHNVVKRLIASKKFRAPAELDDGAGLFRAVQLVAPVFFEAPADILQGLREIGAIGQAGAERRERPGEARCPHDQLGVEIHRDIEVEADDRAAAGTRALLEALEKVLEGGEVLPARVPFSVERAAVDPKQRTHAEREAAFEDQGGGKRRRPIEKRRVRGGPGAGLQPPPRQRLADVMIVERRHKAVPVACGDLRSQDVPTDSVYHRR